MAVTTLQPHGHGHSQSVSNIEFDESKEEDFATPSRRNTYGRGDIENSAIPAPSSALARRRSGTIISARRTSGGALAREGDGGDKSMKPPSVRPRML